MKKTLKEVADYLKEILVPEANEAYELKPLYGDAENQENIRRGILAFRQFLVRLYSELQEKGDLYDTCKKAAHEYENRTTLSVYYPFLHNVGTILLRMGYHGRMGSQSFLCDSSIFSSKLSVGKNLECLSFLESCGIVFEGIDLKDKKQNLQDIKKLSVAYPQNPSMLTGLKVMAIAEIDHGTLLNQDIFLRCDYRVLKKEETDGLAVLQDTIRPLPPRVGEFVLNLHKRYVEKGLVCTAEIKGFHIYIKYSFRRKDFWGLNASLNNGYHINVKSTKTHEYPDVVKKLPPVLQQLIEKGYGCGRKREIGHCDGGCRGITIPLDDSVLKIQRDIETWFDNELQWLKRK